MINQEMRAINLRRSDIVNLMLACTALKFEADDPEQTKWNRLHNMLKVQLETGDKVHDILYPDEEE